MDNLLDWLYSQIVGFLGNFFAEMGNMGVELFEMSWVQSVVLFFNQLGWALFGVSLVVACFECGIEYSSGRGNIQQTALNAIKGFMAVSLFSIVPVRLYALSVSLQGLMTTGLAGSGESIGSVGTRIIEELMTTDTLEAAMIGSRFGITAITSPIMLIFCIILMAYAVIKITMPGRHPAQIGMKNVTSASLSFIFFPNSKRRYPLIAFSQTQPLSQKPSTLPQSHF